MQKQFDEIMATVTFEYDMRNAAMQHMIQEFMALGAKLVSSSHATSAREYSYNNLNAASKTPLKNTANYKKRTHYTSASSLMEALNS